MPLSMPHSRKLIHKQDETAARLRKEVRAAGITGLRKQRQAIQKAANGRPADLAEKARKSLQERRVQRALDMIAGRV